MWGHLSHFIAENDLNTAVVQYRSQLQVTCRPNVWVLDTCNLNCWGVWAPSTLTVAASLFHC